MNSFKIIIIVLLFLSCAEKQTDLNYEKSVMDELFVDLIDSIYYDMRTDGFIGRPPPPGGFKSEEQRIENHRWNEKMRKVYELNKLKILNDTNRILIIVNDTVKKYRHHLRLLNHKYYENIVFLNHPPSIINTYVLDLTKFSENKKYLFTYRSKFPEFWSRQFFRALRENPPKNHFGAVVGFSRICFDKEKMHGVLSGWVSYAVLNGASYNIYIRKKNEKWQIDKIELTEVS